MRPWIAFLIAVALACGAMVAAESKKPPVKLVFPSKAGDVAFEHAAHLKRQKGDCGACHDKLWPQSAAEPLKSSSGCRACHTAGGAAFEMKGNCQKCHPEGGTKA